jgi:hypothetical protein
MAKSTSLLGGRNSAPLSSEEVRRAMNVFLSFDEKVVDIRYEPGEATVFRVATDERGDQYGQVRFGADIYPGTNIIDPNSALSLEAAAAHELTHFRRWQNKQALSKESLRHLDEAFTSLQAVSLYSDKLNAILIKQLVADALQRLGLFMETDEFRAAFQSSTENQLLHSDTLREISGLVDVAAAADGDVVREELEGDDFEDGK